MTAGVYTYTVNGSCAMRQRHGDGHCHGERCAERRHERFAHALLQRSGCWVDHEDWVVCLLLVVHGAAQVRWSVATTIRQR